MDADIAELTDDEFEQAVLAAEFAEIIDPDDPMHEELAQISTQISNLRQVITPLQRKLIAPLVQHQTNTEIANKIGCTSTTVAKARANSTVRRIMALYERTHRIADGPTQQQRAYLLWDIAKRNHKDKPSVAIKAVDTLNKQEGVYHTGDMGGNGGITVVTREFKIVNTSDHTTTPAQDMTLKAEEAIEGVFTPITVEVPDVPSE